MAVDNETLAAIASLIDSKLETAKADMAAEAAKPVVHTNDELQNQPENQPDYWVHLADGSVFLSKDAAATHMVNPDTGKTEIVIGHYPAGS